MSGTKCKVLVLGGVGMIGRNLVDYLVKNSLCQLPIRVADKKLPEIANMTAEMEALFLDESKVQYVQADLSRETHVARAFSGDAVDIVINLAGETRYGLSDEVYAEKCRNVSVAAARAAAAASVGHFIEVSTAHVYDSQSKRSQKEDAKPKPWTRQAQAKLDAESDLAGIDGLKYTIVRPAIVYGPGDWNGLMPRVVCAAVYKHLGETMKFLWGGGLKINTVHVRDVVRALWHLSQREGTGEIFNLADKGKTDQAKVNAVLSRIFGIKTGFHGTIISNVARMRLSEVVETANEKHLAPWTELLAEHKVESTPLTPFIDGELLRNKHLNVDGSKIESTGFTYEVLELDESTIRSCVSAYVKLNAFPAIPGIPGAEEGVFNPLAALGGGGGGGGSGGGH